jgi:hypothetical protein
MSHEKIGPKEAMLRSMREHKAAKIKKPSAPDLRKQVAKIKMITKHGGRRGR